MLWRRKTAEANEATLEPRLKSDLWVKALVRRLDVELMTAMVTRSGDSEAGAIYLKLNFLNGKCRVLNRIYGENGERLWSGATGDTPVDEARADDYLQRQITFDPDCWIVEIEDPNGTFSIDDLVA